MSLWLFSTIAAVLILAAIGLLFFGLWSDRSKGKLRCPKCWYDMTGSVESGSLVCPECGKNAGVEKRLTKNHRRWWAMMVAVVLVMPHCYGGWILYGWWREQEAVAAIEKLDGRVGWGSIAPDTLLEYIPQLLHRYSNRVEVVDYVRDIMKNAQPVSDADLVQLRRLTRLQVLNLSHTNVTDAGIVHLQGLTELRSLVLINTKVTRLEELTHLQELWLSDSQVTDDGLIPLNRMTQLRELYLDRTKVTDDGLAHLQGLTQLQYLYLQDGQVTDAGLVHLNALTQLKELVLLRTEVTDDGAAELQKALPNCEIHYSPP